MASERECDTGCEGECMTEYGSDTECERECTSECMCDESDTESEMDGESVRERTPELIVARVWEGTSEHVSGYVQECTPMAASQEDTQNIDPSRTSAVQRGRQYPLCEQQYRGKPMLDFQVTPTMVSGALSGIGTTKSAGPESIYPALLKALAMVLADPLAIIFNTTLVSGTVPDDWWDTVTIPIHKKGPKDKVTNYRSINLTSAVFMVWERLVKSAITGYLANSSVFCNAQHGFAKGRFCLINLLCGDTKPCGFVYMGMMIGAFFWGGLADKIGRRQCLLISLSFNAFFTSLSSFVQGYGIFLFCRFLSGIGVGGTMPIVFSYFAEFLSREKRGEHLSWMCMFGMIGGIYASAMAWAIIPHYGWSFSMGSAYQFHSWRVFVIVCAIPAIAAVVALTLMPEGPRYLLQMGRHDEAWMVLKQVHDINMRARGKLEKVFSVTQIKTLKQEGNMPEVQADTRTWYHRWIFRITSMLRSIWITFLSCIQGPLKKTTTMLMVIWFTLAFGYFGLSVWFPEVIKQLQAEDYASRVIQFDGETVENFYFNFTLENQVHNNGKYINGRFVKMKFKHVIFENSLFKYCDFDDITSSNTFFSNCTFLETYFYNTVM
uniref:synaptic vesicle glycoprotein 2A-like n=1 Tax=Myxine glutinosa TaxID=7769 RepID=UPI00358E944E